VFFLVNVTYVCLIFELMNQTDAPVPAEVRKTMRIRSVTTLCIFGAATGIALLSPSIGLVLCIFCLSVYLRPEPPRQTVA
jgi:hypothetical protein